MLLLLAINLRRLLNQEFDWAAFALVMFAPHIIACGLGICLGVKLHLRCARCLLRSCWSLTFNRFQRGTVAGDNSV